MRKEDEMVAWYLQAGFVAREGERYARPFGGGKVLVTLRRVVAKDRGELLRGLEYVVD